MTLLDAPQEPTVDSQEIDSHEQELRKPQTFQDCLDAGLGSRVKCPFVSCQHNLAILVSHRGVRLIGPEIEDGVPDLNAIEHTCAAQAGPMTLQEIGGHFGLTRERIRQVEKKALAKLFRANVRLTEIVELLAFSETDRCAL